MKIVYKMLDVKFIFTSIYKNSLSLSTLCIYVSWDYYLMIMKTEFIN